MPRYDNKFFEYVNSGSIGSAEVVLPIVIQNLPIISSVLDVGCGQGAWLSVWRELGVDDVVGIDGEYVNQDMLLIPREQFVSADLGKSFDVGRQFDLVQCLEVAEHLPSSESKAFVEKIVAHGGIVMFSAAPKGQGGDHHVNEQSYDYWRSLFRTHRYVVLDCIRPKIAGIDAVEPWYRYNTFLYVHEDHLPQLPEEFRSARIQDHVKLRDVSPIFYKVRKHFVRLLPVSFATKFAKTKELIVARLRRKHG